MKRKPPPVASLQPDGSVAFDVCGERVLVDADDFAAVAAVSWTSSRRRNGKVYIRDSAGLLYLHRFITGAAAGVHVDHWNGDPRDNRRSNLRDCSASQNGANSHSRGGSSRFKGVSRDLRSGTWQAYIRVGRHRRHLGSYAREEDAALAYDIAAVEAWGEFAALNLPETSHEHAPTRLRVGRKATVNRWGINHERKKAEG